MIPYVPPELPRFNEFFNFEEDFSWSQIEYNNTCDSAAVKTLIGPMMGSLNSISFISAPYASVLRVAEGIDSIRNIAKSNDNSLSDFQRGTAVLCAVSQLGGVIWMAVVVIILLGFSLCAPIGSWLCLFGYRFVKGKGRREREREQAIDALLDSEQSIDAFLENRRNSMSKIVSSKRVSGSGHVLLPSQDDVEVEV
jgi:hypothetical protein